MSHVPPALTFTLIDADPDFPGFAVEASAEGFSGTTEAWASRADVRKFLANLEEFDAALRGEVRWHAGFEPQASVALLIRPFGQTGRLEVIADLVASPATEGQHRVHLSFVLPEPNVLTRFRLALAAVVAGTSIEQAVLTPAHREARV